MSKADRKCRDCGVILTSDNAYMNKVRGTFQSACKLCGSKYTKAWIKRNREKERKRARKYYKENTDRVRMINERSRVKRKYGITLEEIEFLKKSQNYRCAICMNAMATCVDHCHKLGVVRGILCSSCNTAIGHMKDEPRTLRAAALYLETTKKYHIYRKGDK